jgi:hypothetical protein
MKKYDVKMRQVLYTIRDLKCTNVILLYLWRKMKWYMKWLMYLGLLFTTLQSGRPGMATVGHQKVGIIITVNKNRLENNRNSFTSKNMAL